MTLKNEKNDRADEKKIIRLFNSKMRGAWMFANHIRWRNIYILSFVYFWRIRATFFPFKKHNGENSPSDNKQNELKNFSRILFSF